jgi:hypothetical protein
MGPLVLLCGSVGVSVIGMILLLGFVPVAFITTVGLKALGLRLGGWQPRRTVLRDALTLTLISSSGGVCGMWLCAGPLREAAWRRNVDSSVVVLLSLGVIAALIDSVMLYSWTRGHGVQALEHDGDGNLFVGARPRRMVMPWLGVVGADVIAVVALISIISGR